MIKPLLLLFSLWSYSLSAQSSTDGQKFSRSWDPEVLWFQVDSLNAVDTTKARLDLAAYYNLRYKCEQSLYWFDKQKYHLTNSLKWSSGECFHNRKSIEPLIHGLEICSKLKEYSLGDHYYKMILSKSTEKEWTASQKRTINNAASELKLVDYNKHEGPYGIDFPIDYICCEMDTTVKMHSNVAINKNVETYRHYELVKGEKNCLEVLVNTKNCRCSDAGFSSKMFIELNDTLLPQSIELSNNNLFWTNENVWRIDAKEDIQYGKLFRNEHGIYLILVVKLGREDQNGILETEWIAPEYLVGMK